MNIPKYIFVGFAFFLLSSLSSKGLATNYYVSPAGSDGNDGSKAAPFASIQKAADIVNPGDVVIVKDGVYTAPNGNQAIVSINRAGDEKNWIVFKAENKWGAVLHGDKTSTKYGFLFLQNAKYVRVEHFEIKSTSRDMSEGWNMAGIWSNSGADFITIAGNYIHEVHGGAFHGENCEYHIYDRNIFKNIGRLPEGHPTSDYAHDHGIYAVGSHTDILNNVFIDCKAGWGVQIAGYGEEHGDYYNIINNTFVGTNPQRNGQLMIYSACHDILIQNNIFYQPKGAAIVTYGGGNGKQYNVTIRNNITEVGYIATITCTRSSRSAHVPSAASFGL